jgi:hypothetical protein
MRHRHSNTLLIIREKEGQEGTLKQWQNGTGTFTCMPALSQKRRGASVLLLTKDARKQAADQPFF